MIASIKLSLSSCSSILILQQKLYSITVSKNKKDNLLVTEKKEFFTVHNILDDNAFQIPLHVISCVIVPYFDFVQFPDTETISLISRYNPCFLLNGRIFFFLYFFLILYNPLSVILEYRKYHLLSVLGT